MTNHLIIQHISRLHAIQHHALLLRLRSRNRSNCLALLDIERFADNIDGTYSLALQISHKLIINQRHSFGQRRHILYLLDILQRPLEIIDQFTLPGMDEIFTRQFNDNMEWLTFATVEHGIRRTGNGGLAELFALGPCDMSLARMKKTMRLAGMFGVDHYVLAVAQLDMRGNVEKCNYFNPYSRTQPWFRALKLLGEDAALSADIAGKPFHPEIQIRYPGVPRLLNDLLMQLVERQRSWSVINAEESGSAAFILRLEQEGITEERSGRTWRSVEVFLNDLEKRSPLRVYVTESDGSRARDIFLRNYADGSIEVVNLSRSPQERALLLHRNGQAIPFPLAFDGTASFGGWKIELDRPNLKRLDFENGLCRVVVRENLPAVTLALRDYGGRVELRLDGKPIEAKSVCTSLPQGFRELYREKPAIFPEKRMHFTGEICTFTGGKPERFRQRCKQHYELFAKVQQQ